MAERVEASGLNLAERIIDIWRVSATVKGGRRMSFAAMVVVGNGDGVVGMGYGKAREVPNAIEKAVKDAKKNLQRVYRYGTTIPHEVRGRFGSSEVILIPALPGTGIIAGQAVRAVLESIGVHDILSKSVGGSNNGKNLVKAAMDGVLRLRPRESYAKLRGVEIPEDAVLAKSLKAFHSAPRKPVASMEGRDRRGPSQDGGRRRRGPQGNRDGGPGSGGSGGGTSGGGSSPSLPITSSTPEAAAPATPAAETKPSGDKKE